MSVKESSPGDTVPEEEETEKTPVGEESDPAPVKSGPDDAPVADDGEPGETDSGETEPGESMDEPGEEDGEAEAGPEALGPERWYVVHSFSGHEQKVKRYIESQISERFPDRVRRVLIPTEEIVRTRGGKKVSREKKLYPGYVFALLDLTEEMVMDIRAMSNVSGFPPMNKGFPQPLSKDEVERILGQAEGREAPKSVRVPFSTGQTVRVISGPFNNFSGVVESINAERGRVRVIFTIFGRKAPVELDFSQVRIN